MEEELKYIKTAKQAEKEEIAQRKTFAGGAHWSRSTANVSLRHYDKQFTAAMNARPPSGTAKKRGSSAKATTTPQTKASVGAGTGEETEQATTTQPVQAVVLSKSMAGRSARSGLFDMPKLPKPDKAAVLGITQQREDAERATQAAAAQRASQQAAAAAAAVHEEVLNYDEVLVGAPGRALRSRGSSRGSSNAGSQEVEVAPAVAVSACSTPSGRSSALGRTQPMRGRRAGGSPRSTPPSMMWMRSWQRQKPRWLN